MLQHPLDGAFAHVDRADRNFRELETILNAFSRKYEKDPFADYDPAPLKIANGESVEGFGRTPLDSPPIEAAVLVSAIIHHLRAALDYLVHELAVLDSPHLSNNGTQFIIEDVKSDPSHPKRGFDAKAKTRLRGLNPINRDAIEDLQPYKGAKWTQLIRDISNPDKHRKLTVIRSRTEARHRIEGGAPGSFDDRPGKTWRGIGEKGADVHMEADYSIQVMFPEREDLPVLHTLHGLKIQVRTTLTDFKPEFK